MSEVGKAAKHMGLTHPRDLKRVITDAPERATPARKEAHPTKQYGIEYKYAPSLRFFKNYRPFHKWFKTKSARDQSVAHMRREQHGGHDFYVILRVIDP
jgi:hypothetical protein